MSGPDAPGWFECPLPVRWSDQDLFGHVNNARIVTLLEELRVTAFRERMDWRPDRRVPRVLRTLNVDYRRPVHDVDPLTGRLWISRIGRSSFVVQHALHQAGRPVVTAEAVLVQLHPDQSGSRPLDDDARASLGRILRPDVTAHAEADAEEHHASSA